MVAEVQVAAPVPQAVHKSKAVVVAVVWKKPVPHSQAVPAVLSVKPVAQVEQPALAAHVKHPVAHGAYTKPVAV